jgi:hypothetical protein
MVRSSAAVIPTVILRALLGTSANYWVEAMWAYLLVFLAAFIVDTIPVFTVPIIYDGQTDPNYTGMPSYYK